MSQFTTYGHLIEDTKALIAKLDGPLFAVVGIPRSGMLPATIVAEACNCRLASLDLFLEMRFYVPGAGSGGDQSNRVLVLDDSLYAGAAMDLARRRIGSYRYLYDQYQITYGAVYVRPETVHLVDLYGALLPAPRLFEWNWLRHKSMEDTMWDLDGAICDNPIKPEEQYGEEEFVQHLNSVRPLHVPRRTIAEIVTGRLERYRKETLAWLSKHNIPYRALTMCRANSVAERHRLGGAAMLKGRTYLRSKATLFVESSAAEAQIIATESRKPVLCIEDFKVY